MPLSRAILDAAVESQPNAKCPNGTSASMEQLDEQKAIARNWERVKKLVAERDKGRCRMCGKRCILGARYLSERADPHHIVFKSKAPKKADYLLNECGICRICHDKIHKLRTLKLTGSRLALSIWEWSEQLGEKVVTAIKRLPMPAA